MAEMLNSRSRNMEREAQTQHILTQVSIKSEIGSKVVSIKSEARSEVDLLMHLSKRAIV